MRKIFLFSCMVVYFIVGVGARVFTFPQEEIFPIYSWSLFSTVPNTVYRYDVQILTRDGTALNTPLFYNEAEDFVPHPEYISVYITIQAWGKALNGKNHEEAQKLQQIFEKLHLYPNTRYQLSQIKYNPIERWQKNLVWTTPMAEYLKN